MYNEAQNVHQEMDRPELTYGHSMGSHQFISHLKIILFYAFELVFWVIVARLYQNFGSSWIVPSVSAMWVMGAITTWYIREEQEGTVKETKWVILGFLAFLFMYRIVIQLIAPISSEQMQASLNITMPAASGMAITGMLQNILMIVSVMTPIGYLIWCAQKFRVYNGRANKQEAFSRIKDYRNGPKR